MLLYQRLILSDQNLKCSWTQMLTHGHVSFHFQGREAQKLIPTFPQSIQEVMNFHLLRETKGIESLTPSHASINEETTWVIV